MGNFRNSGGGMFVLIAIFILMLFLSWIKKKKQDLANKNEQLRGNKVRIDTIIEDRKSVKAKIEWYKDPSHYPMNVWLRDIVLIYGEIVGKQIYGDTWTVLVRITELVDNSWSTFADVAFIVDEAPWHLLEEGYSFKLWTGRGIATVTIL